MVKTNDKNGVSVKSSKKLNFIDLIDSILNTSDNKDKTCKLVIVHNSLDNLSFNTNQDRLDKFLNRAFVDKLVIDNITKIDIKDNFLIVDNLKIDILKVFKASNDLFNLYDKNDNLINKGYNCLDSKSNKFAFIDYKKHNKSIVKITKNSANSDLNKLLDILNLSKNDLKDINDLNDLKALIK